MDVFLILELSKNVCLNRRQFLGEIKLDISTLLTLPSANVKSAVFLRIPSLAKVQIHNFLLLHFPRSNLICIYNMWKGWSICICQLSLWHSQTVSFFWIIFFVTEAPPSPLHPWRDLAQCELLRLHFQFSFNKLLKALQFFVFITFWRNVLRSLQKFP